MGKPSQDFRSHDHIIVVLNIFVAFSFCFSGEKSHSVCQCCFFGKLCEILVKVCRVIIAVEYCHKAFLRIIGNKF